MHHHLLKWMTFLEERLGRTLEPEDYIFPYFGPNGVPHPRREMTHDMIQGILNEFVVGAGLHKFYTTHCFRRGGAQHRFMYAPLGRRWSLSIIRWWGGWAIGEHVSKPFKIQDRLTNWPTKNQVDTLIKYLVDSLQSYESGHGDALCPIAKEAEKSFMGDHLRVGPVSTEEYRRRQEIIDEKMAALLQAITLNATNSYQHVIRALQSTADTGLDGPQTRRQITPEGPPGQASGPHTSDHEVTPPALFPTQSQQLATTASPATPKPIPIPGVSISDLGHSPSAWRKAIQQWEECDPATGLVALKNWPKEWYTGVMRTHTGAKRTTRKTIADEYNRSVILYPSIQFCVQPLTSRMGHFADSSVTRRDFVMSIPRLTETSGVF